MVSWSVVCTCCRAAVPAAGVSRRRSFSRAPFAQACPLTSDCMWIARYCSACAVTSQYWILTTHPCVLGVSRLALLRAGISGCGLSSVQAGELNTERAHARRGDRNSQTLCSIMASKIISSLCYTRYSEKLANSLVPVEERFHQRPHEQDTYPLKRISRLTIAH